MADNPYKDLINTTMDPADKTAIKDHFDAIKEIMDAFLADIPVEERKKGHKIGKHRRGFSHEANDAAHDHPEIIPSAFSVPGHDNDRSLEGDMEDVETWAAECFEVIDDTHLIVGRELYAGGLDIYKYVQAAEGLDTLKAKLGEWHERAQQEEAEEEAGDNLEEPQ